VNNFTNMRTADSRPRRNPTVALTWSRSIDWDTDDWRDVSACRDTSPTLFFPVGTTGPAIEQIEAAKAVCRSCPAQAPCLEFALATNQESGVWGGTSEEERRKLRKVWLSRQRQAAAS
jgi:WhiB family transcriptional regulator, redox-sensing transcriptional regulator